MQLIERYLHAVEFWLPKEKKQDILAELSEDIHSQVEEQQKELGRDLNEDEIVALLKKRGRPVTVANRFQAQRYLIGPSLFPIYWFLVKVVAFFYLVPGFVVSAVIYHTQHPDRSWATTVAATGAGIWTTGLITLGIVTMIFALVQATGIAERDLENWNPRRLTPVKERNKISRANSVTNIVANLVFLLWWGSYFSSLKILHGTGIYLELTPAWKYFYWGFLGVGVLKTGLAAANLLHPHWTRSRASINLLMNLANGLLFCWMMRAHLIASLSVASLGTSKSALLAHAMESYALTVLFPIALIITVVVFMVDLLRVLRTAEQQPPPAAAGLRGSLQV